MPTDKKELKSSPCLECERWKLERQLPLLAKPTSGDTKSSEMKAILTQTLKNHPQYLNIIQNK
jgi:hypothetical protein